MVEKPDSLIGGREDSQSTLFRSRLAVGVHLILAANEAYSEVIEFFERRQQMACAACETVELPNQRAVDFMVSGYRHQGIELGTALSAA
jgi:hypothetical protein